MLTILDFTLKSSFEAVLLLAALLLYLVVFDQKSKQKWLWAGAGLALVFAFILAYGVRFFGNRELVELLWLSGTLLSLVALAILGLGGKGTVLPKVMGPLVLLSAVFLLTLPAAELITFPDRIFVQSLINQNLVNTELIAKWSGALVGILVAVVTGWTFTNSVMRMSKKAAGLTTLVIVLIVLARQLIILLQLGMALGLIPVSAFLVSLVAPVINTYYPMFFYFLVLVITLQILFVRFRAKAPVLSETGNPALRRKTLAGFRVYIRWLTVTGVLLLMTGSLLGAGYVKANETIKLSPPVPVQAQNGVITLPVSEVSDKKLHRYSYVTKDNVTMRFLVIDKGNGLFGVGLDACPICGVAGYYQRGNDVICINCDVVINKVTIGFTGGCNPIPLLSKQENSGILIKVTDLEELQKIFE